MANDNDRVVRLTSTPTELEAGVIVGGLEERGIRATMSGVYSARFRIEAPGWVEVLVAEDDLPQAQAMLDEVRSEHSDIDWSNVDTGDSDNSDASGTYSWFPTFRRVCLALVAVYLVWVGVVFTINLFQFAVGIFK